MSVVSSDGQHWAVVLPAENDEVLSAVWREELMVTREVAGYPELCS